MALGEIAVRRHRFRHYVREPSEIIRISIKTWHHALKRNHLNRKLCNGVLLEGASALLKFLAKSV
jgi:hypothetical protein